MKAAVTAVFSALLLLGCGTSPADPDDPVENHLRFTEVTAGGSHSCGLTDDGVGYCWGNNSYGQLGIGSDFMPGNPTHQLSGDLDLGDIAAGSFHTCALTTAGAAYCSGGNWNGQLGTGSNDGSDVPVPVQTSLRFTSIWSGGSHSCGRATAGGVHCWGFNGNGELGDGTYEDRRTPVQVVDGARFTTLALGTDHSCGLTSTGAAYCWGSRPGDPRAERSVPSALGGGMTFAELALGLTSCALTSGGDPYCWDVLSPEPTAVAVGTGFHGLVAGKSHFCALTTVGDAYCWGDNGWGQFGSGDRSDSEEPAPSGGGLSFLRLAGGERHSCGIVESGAVYCWGVNQYGQLGTDDVDEITTVPVAVEVTGG